MSPSAFPCSTLLLREPTAGRDATAGAGETPALRPGQEEMRRIVHPFYDSGMRRSIILLLVFLSAGYLFGQTVTKPAIDPSEYAARRARVAKEIGPNGMLVLFSPKLQIRSGDQEWPFRQSNDLLYLTGIDEEETTLVMVPGDPEFAEVLFVRDRNPQQEVWTGRIPSHEEITKVSGIQRVESSRVARNFINTAITGWPWVTNFDALTERLPPRSLPHFYDAIVKGSAEIWTVDEARIPDPTAPATQEQLFVRDLRERHPSLLFREAQPMLVHMREVKSAAEIAVIQHAIDITEAAQKAAMKRVLTATSENQVDAVIDFTYKDLGTCCWAFPSIAASGKNTTTLHYMTNNGPVDRQGLFLTDLGAEYLGYSADVTRTYPASGKFSADQRAIHDAVFAAQEAAIAALKPGGHFRDADHAAIAVIGRELARLGLISNAEPRQIFMYFRHVPGHHIGLETHDVADRDRKIEPNMVFAVEPGIYVRKNDVLASPVYAKLSKEEQATIAKALDRYDGIGVRIEDNVVITETGARLLSSGSPRKSDDIERFMAR
jgi:Xaa-Pro aminopeptidase